MKIAFQKLHPNVPTPKKAHASDAGFDVQYFNADDARFDAVVLQPECRHAFSTGIRLCMEEGWECQVRPRSGLACKLGVTVANSPGTVDAGYRGEVVVVLINHSSQPQIIKNGERIAQLVFQKVPEIQLVEDYDIQIHTDRGVGGFGSSGQ